MPLSTKAIEAIKRDSDLRAKLMLAGGRSEYTIKRYLIKNDDELTKPKYTAVIIDETGFTLEEILELDAKKLTA